MLRYLLAILLLWTFQLTWAINVEVPPLDEWQANVGASYYENIILWPDGEIIKSDADLLYTTLRVINEYMWRIIGPMVFGLLIYGWFNIITWAKEPKEVLKGITKIIIGIMIAILAYTAIRFIVNLY